jgi:cation diffusion facilitator CzcD-associated flavoprotein CzcO
MSARVEHVDVLVVGAGISGIGGAYHLTQQRPDTSFIVLENQDGFGGTWRTHTYPGIRSDSDLHTFGYRFKAWRGAPIASGEEIMKYLGEVIDENDLAPHIRYNHQITTASWSSADNVWMIDVTRTDTGEQLHFSAGFLWMCQGYYRHSEGYTPEWEGMADFQGQIVHPQTWPSDLEYEGKDVVVIGSGATAATLIPAMADATRHITMLQRSPTFFATGRNAVELVEMLREIDIDEDTIHAIARKKKLHDQNLSMHLARNEPEAVRAELLAGIREIVGEEYDVDTHFNPSYRPWRQRVAFVPDGDLFHGIASGKASVVTDHIVRFNETGIELESGRQLDADIVVTATGFNLNVLGDIEFVIDGEPLMFHDTVTYRGTMFTGIPNLAWVFGYFRASWTLRADLVADFVCRLLQEMDDRGASTVIPTLRTDDEDMELLPWVDPENFNPGYLTRSLHLLPKQGDREPWRHKQDYWLDKDELPAADLDDGTLTFT